MSMADAAPFATEIVAQDGWLAGPWRKPRQMLAAQEYDEHASIHDDATAQKLGFKGGTIEGPTHFSQFMPLFYAIWGERWFAEGGISVCYRNACYAGDEVRAFAARPKNGETQVAIRMERADGMEILAGTASIGRANPASAVAQKLAQIRKLEQTVILRAVEVGMKRPRVRVVMGGDDMMGALYPFSLNRKLAVITEPSPWFRPGNTATPWGRAVIPVEMVSVLLNHVSAGDPWVTQGPAVALFTDQEIEMFDGPLFVGQDYEIAREVVALSGSRRTETIWTRASIFAPGCDQPIASMLLSTAILKESYVPYESERQRLYGV